MQCKATCVLQNPCVTVVTGAFSSCFCALRSSCSLCGNTRHTGRREGKAFSYGRKWVLYMLEIMAVLLTVKMQCGASGPFLSPAPLTELSLLWFQFSFWDCYLEKNSVSFFNRSVLWPHSPIPPCSVLVSGLGCHCPTSGLQLWRLQVAFGSGTFALVCQAVLPLFLGCSFAFLLPWFFFFFLVLQSSVTNC